MNQIVSGMNSLEGLEQRRVVENITGHDLNVDGGTNAANGYYQTPPIHQAWNADTRPRIGEGYPGVVPRPDWYQAMEAGVPGIHYDPPAE